MQKIFTNENRILVWNVKNILEHANIKCIIKNEFLSGGAGELAPNDVWPELWLVDEALLQHAQNLIEAMVSLGQSGLPAWICDQCGEDNDGHFEVCWNCTHEHN